MVRYLLQRLADGLIAIWGVVTIVFIISRLLGDPAVLLLPIGASEEHLKALRASLGLDRPLLEQYVSYVLGILRGDFGQSFQYMRPALEVVLERLPATAMLAGCALLIGVVLGGIAGSLAALYRGTVVEAVVMLLALLGQATPTFWLGLLLILVFAVDLGWLPTGGLDGPQSLVLPAITLGVFTTASIARLLRSDLLDVMKEDFVRTARAKGLKPRAIYFWHMLRNALIPVVTMIGILTGELLGGSVVTETIFSWPGVGRVIVQAMEGKDFPVVQAGVLMIATTFVFVNIIVDMLYGLLDPRIRHRR